MYRCSICKKEYDTAIERARCEIACYEKAEKEAEKARKEKLAKIKDDRKIYIESVYETLQSEINKYKQDYGENPLTICRNFSPIEEFINIWNER